MSPKISVILPTYNRAHLIEESIESVLNQTFSDFELLVVDDGSTDNTKEIINKFNDARLRYIYIENKGRSYARNLAIKESKGKFITFVDSDDLYFNDKIEKQINYFKTYPDCHILYTSAVCIDELGSNIPYTFEAIKSGNIYSQIAFLKPVTIALPTVMVARTVLDEVGVFDLNMSRFEDIDLWRRISKKFDFYALKEYTCKIRTHSQNHLASQDPMDIAKAIDFYAKKINHEDADISILVRKIGLGRLYYYYATNILKNTSWKIQGRYLLCKAFFHNPFLAIYYCLSFFKTFILKLLKIIR